MDIVSRRLLCEMANNSYVNIFVDILYLMQQAMFEEARKYPGQEKDFFDFVQKNDEVQQQIRAPLFEDKVVDFIVELATITEKKVSKDNLQKALEKED